MALRHALHDLYIALTTHHGRRVESFTGAMPDTPDEQIRQAIDRAVASSSLVPVASTRALGEAAEVSDQPAPDSPLARVHEHISTAIKSLLTSVSRRP